MVHIPLDHAVGFEPTIGRGFLESYLKYIICMYMYYIDDVCQHVCNLIVSFFKDVVFIYLYYLHKVYYFNIYGFVFLLKSSVKYQKIEKLPKLRQNMHRCANDNLHLIRPSTHSVQLYCRLSADFFEKW